MAIASEVASSISSWGSYFQNVTSRPATRCRWSPTSFAGGTTGEPAAARTLAMASSLAAMPGRLEIFATTMLGCSQTSTLFVDRRATGSSTTRPSVRARTTTEAMMSTRTSCRLVGLISGPAGSPRCDGRSRQRHIASPERRSIRPSGPTRRSVSGTARGGVTLCRPDGVHSRCGSRQTVVCGIDHLGLGSR